MEGNVRVNTTPGNGSFRGSIIHTQGQETAKYEGVGH